MNVQTLRTQHQQPLDGIPGAWELGSALISGSATSPIPWGDAGTASSDYGVSAQSCLQSVKRKTAFLPMKRLGPTRRVAIVKEASHPRTTIITPAAWCASASASESRRKPISAQLPPPASKKPKPPVPRLAHRSSAVRAPNATRWGGKVSPEAGAIPSTDAKPLAYNRVEVQAYMRQKKQNLEHARRQSQEKVDCQRALNQERMHRLEERQRRRLNLKAQNPAAVLVPECARGAASRTGIQGRHRALQYNGSATSTEGGTSEAETASETESSTTRELAPADRLSNVRLVDELLTERLNRLQASGANPLVVRAVQRTVAKNRRLLTALLNGQAGRPTAKPKPAELDRAATCIQAAYRGHCARRRLIEEDIENSRMKPQQQWQQWHPVPDTISVSESSASQLLRAPSYALLPAQPLPAHAFCDEYDDLRILDIYARHQQGHASVSRAPEVADAFYSDDFVSEVDDDDEQQEAATHANPNFGSPKHNRPDSPEEEVLSFMDGGDSSASGPVSRRGSMSSRSDISVSETQRGSNPSPPSVDQQEPVKRPVVSRPADTIAGQVPMSAEDGGRLSPHSLQRKLMAELQHGEAIEESVRRSAVSMPLLPHVVALLFYSLPTINLLFLSTLVHILYLLFDHCGMACRC